MYIKRLFMFPFKTGQVGNFLKKIIDSMAINYALFMMIRFRVDQING